MTDEQNPAIDDHDLDLSLGLSSTRSLNNNNNNNLNNFQFHSNQKVLLNPDFQIVSNHEEEQTVVNKELKRKVGNVCDDQNDVVREQEGVLERRCKVINIGSKSSFSWGGNAGGFRVYQGQNSNFVGVNEGNAGNRSSGSSESSSGFSESYHTSSNAGGNNSDTSSNSSHHLQRFPSVNLQTASPSAKQTVFSSQEDTHTQFSRKITSTNSKDKDKEPSPIPQSRSTSPKAPKLATGKPPKPSRQMSQQSVLLPEIPCVSATGNGPDGKTVTGFLYKYSKTEVSIVCVCHGASFTPSGFVEHAGGVDIEHPLKHIRVVPYAVT